MRILHGRKTQTDIDLLTEEESVKSSKSKYNIILISVGIVILELLVFAFYSFLGIDSANQVADLKHKIDLENQVQASMSKVTAELNVIKSKLGTYNQFSAKYAGMDKKLNKLAAVLPITISLETLDINNAGKILLKASVANPADAYEFYQKISTDPAFSALSMDTISKSGDNYTLNMSFGLKIK